MDLGMTTITVPQIKYKCRQKEFDGPAWQGTDVIALDGAD